VVGLVIVVGALGLGFLDSRSSDDDPPPETSTTTTTEAPAREGPCDGLSQEAIDAALGGPSVISVVDVRRCSVAREGTLVSADVEQTEADATAEDLDAVERSSGPDADSLEPWPEEEVEDLGDAAVWLADPAAEGSYGELYVLVGTRIVRTTISTPPDYRREALTIATQVAAAAIADL